MRLTSSTGHRRQGVRGRVGVCARRGAQEPRRRRQGAAQPARQGAAVPVDPHRHREGDRAEGRPRLRADDLRLRPAALRRPLVRLRRQRLVVREGLAQVLGRLRQPAPPVLPRGDRSRPPRALPARHHAARSQASLGLTVYHQPQPAALDECGRPAAARGARRVQRLGAPLCRRRHAPRRPHAEAEAQVLDIRTGDPRPPRQERRRRARRAQDQEGAPDGGALSAASRDPRSDAPHLPHLPLRCGRWRS